MKGRILAVDPGDRRIGIAISDPSGTIARPLMVLDHVQRLVDAARIVQLAVDNEVQQIVIGQALDDENRPTPSGRKAARLAEAIQSQTNLPVVLWDEHGSTNLAQETMRQMQVKRSHKKGHADDLAAAMILQSYLEAHLPGGNKER